MVRNIARIAPQPCVRVDEIVEAWVYRRHPGTLPVTVTPSIDASGRRLWHGHITNGDIKVKQSALADRQRAAAFGIFWRLVQELLQQIDLDYYRSAQLLIVRAELEQLRQGRSALADVERRSKIPLATSPQGIERRFL
jgi:hypothetical protein